MALKVSFHPYGERTLLIQWSQVIDQDILHQIRSISDWLHLEMSACIIDIVPAYASLTIIFDPEKTTHEALKQCVIRFDGSDLVILEPATWNIPVHYASEDHPDMTYVIRTCGITREELVAIHAASDYIVHFIGFLPGFLYLGGLDSRLHIPRKQVPDLAIPRGSVAIGGQQTGIYPVQSPGGWYVIGSTDLEWFDFRNPPHCLIKPGDRVRFVELSEVVHGIHGG
jgi:inhibitor of KinA